MEFREMKAYMHTEF